MKKEYFDGHVHTGKSDGNLSRQQIIDLARQSGVGVLAITDHNCPCENLEELRRENPDMILISGSEISCQYRCSDGKEIEVHVLAYGFDPDDEGMQYIFRYNHSDRRPYVNAILEKLKMYGIDVGSYDDLVTMFPETSYVGRASIGRAMVRKGFVASVDEAFDLFLGGGANQKRLAYVPNPTRYISLEEAVPLIEKAGCASLAHLLYYNLSDQENEALVSRFAALGGSAMETEYRRYTRQQRDALGEIARRHGLIPSAGSDFHSLEAGDSLENHFPYEIYEGLKKAWEKPAGVKGGEKG